MEHNAPRLTPDATPFREIWVLAWPQMLMMVFHFLIGIIDVWAAGRISGQVQASMGLVNQTLFFFLVVAIAVANGSVAAISQSVGAKLPKRVRRYVGLVLMLGVGMGVVVLGVGFAAKASLMGLLQVPEELRDVTADFLAVFLPLMPMYYLFVITNAVFRARKLVKVPLYAMGLTTIANTIGDLGFGLGWWGLPAFGHKGLAWATFMSVACGLAFNLWVLRREGLLAWSVFPPWRWIRRAFPYLFKVAWPGGLMQLLWQSAYLALFAVVGSLPVGSVNALGGMTAGLRVESALFLPGFAFNMTASILVGDLLGQGRVEAARHAVYRILLIGVAALSVAAVAVWWWAEAIAAFIAPDPAIRAETVGYLGWNLAAIQFTLTTMICSGALAGAGATVYNLVAFGLAAWGIRLPLAWLLGHALFGEARGVWMAMFVSQAAQAMLALYIFRYKNWSRFALRKARGANKGA